MKDPLRAIAGDLTKAAKAALAKRGLAAARIVTDWPDIVGAVLADGTAPERLVPNRSKDEDGEQAGGTLVIRVRSGLALELQHLAPLVVERVNSHFGFKAVGRLRLIQGPVTPPDRPKPRVAVKLPPEALAEIDRHLVGIEDEALRQSLQRLGRSILERDARRMKE